MRTAAAVVLLLVVSRSLEAQDFQVGARAKGMGGSYTAFGDDPVAIWSNPAGIATQSSQVAITYQSFTEYDFAKFGDQIPASTTGLPQQGLLDPPISPSFLGLVYQIGTPDLDMAIGLAYIRPFQIKYVYNFNDASEQLVTQTDQQFSRLRASYGVSVRTSSGPFLPRVALGGGLDFVYTKYHEVDQNPLPNRDTQVFDDSQSTIGYGAGLLTTIFESESFMVDAGVAENTAARFHFNLDPTIYPVWDWPRLISGGFAFYLFEGYPLRITVDAQWVAWKHAVGPPAPGFSSFNNTVSYSAGAEYRIKVRESSFLYLRVGLKSYDTPWGSKDNQPALGFSQLSIQTKGDRIEIMTTGLGYYWTRKTWEGQTRMTGFDLAVELFGETRYLFGLGFTYQFD